jgi:hypothetical protein
MYLIKFRLLFFLKKNNKQKRIHLNEKKKKNPHHHPKIRQGGNLTRASEHYTHAQQPSIQ